MTGAKQGPLASDGSTSPAVDVFIRQLTGIRFVAAAWVVLYHFQVPLVTLGLLVPPMLDVIRVGRLGVDLFFALSGFILTHTYLSRLGPATRMRATMRFWWLRLARVYPVHLVMTVVAGAAALAWARLSGSPLDSWLNPFDLARNLLLVQEWGPSPQRGWNFVAWSLSMEWLAYLIFPLLVLLLWRLHRGTRTWILVVSWILVLVPLVVFGLTTTDPYYTDAWGSTIRILTEFTAGALTYLIVVRLLPSSTLHNSAPKRTQRWADQLSWILPALVVAGAVALGSWAPAQPIQDNSGTLIEQVPPYYHLLLVPLLVAWIGALAVSRGPIARLLSTRLLVLGGFISYALYMTHLVWYGLWRAATDYLGINGGPRYFAATAALFAGALVIAWLMWHVVEEPAREWMRGRIGTRRTPTEEAGETIAEEGINVMGTGSVEVPTTAEERLR
jgi:peptidoglycan/LPS O-acetylase OafA/YrhL